MLFMTDARFGNRETKGSFYVGTEGQPFLLILQTPLSTIYEKVYSLIW